MFRSLPLLPVSALDYVLGEADFAEGVVVECGVYKGKSINKIARRFPDRTVYGFDSFEGLPGDWEMGYNKGHFDCGGRLPRVERNVRLVPGWFEDTLREFAESMKGESLALLHVDCDMYESTVTVLREMRVLLRVGTVIVFDELINYPNYQNHEWKAMSEFLQEGEVEVRWIGSKGLYVPEPKTALGDGSEKVACVVTAIN